MQKQNDIPIYNPEMVYCKGRSATINGNKMARYDCEVTERGSPAIHDIKNIGSVEFKSVPYTAKPPVIYWSTMGTSDKGLPFIKVKVSDVAKCIASGNSKDGKSWKSLTCFVPEERLGK